MISCPECRGRNRDQAKSCQKCGAPLKKAKGQIVKSSPSTKLPQLSLPKTAPEFQKVIITDIKIPFWKMAGFMLKCLIASLPAMLVAALLVFLSLSAAKELTNLAKISLREMVSLITKFL